jgi:hypothetical protein
MSYYHYVYWLAMSREDRKVIDSNQIRLLARYLCKLSS